MRAQTLVLGIGNVLMGDEGVGSYTVEALAHDRWPDDVVLLDGGTGGFHLLGWLQGHRHVVLIDAAMDGKPAGTVSVLKPRYASDFPRSLTAHDIGLRDLIESASLLGTLPPMTLITISIEHIRPMFAGLSLPVERAIQTVRDRVRDCVGEKKTVTEVACA